MTLVGLEASTTQEPSTVRCPKRLLRSLVADARREAAAKQRMDTEGELLTEPDDVRVPTLPDLELSGIAGGEPSSSREDQDLNETTKDLKRRDLVRRPSPFDSVPKAEATGTPPVEKIAAAIADEIAAVDEQAPLTSRPDSRDNVIRAQRLFDLSDADQLAPDLEDLDLHRKAASHLSPRRTTATVGWFLASIAAGAGVGLGMFVYSRAFHALPYYAGIAIFAALWSALAATLCRASRLPSWLSVPLATAASLAGFATIAVVAVAKFGSQSQALPATDVGQLLDGLAVMTGLTASGTSTWLSVLAASLCLISLGALQSSPHLGKP